MDWNKVFVKCVLQIDEILDLKEHENLWYAPKLNQFSKKAVYETLLRVRFFATHISMISSSCILQVYLLISLQSTVLNFFMIFIHLSSLYQFSVAKKIEKAIKRILLFPYLNNFIDLNQISRIHLIQNTFIFLLYFSSILWFFLKHFSFTHISYFIMNINLCFLNVFAFKINRKN